jgi:integrase
MSTNHPNRRRRNPNGSGSISQRKDGRYELKIFVTTPEGHRKRISIYRDTWDEADAERTRIKELERRDVPIEVTTMTVAQYLHYWLDQVAEPSVRAHTYTAYEGDIRLHIIPALGNHKLRTLNSREVRAFINNLRTRCQCCSQGKDAARRTPRCCAMRPANCCRDTLAIDSIRHVLKVLRAALQDAVDDQLLGRNVARSVRIAGDTPDKGRFTPAEAQRFLTVAENHPLRALWALALALGLRRGEALGLAWYDVDLTAGRVTIRKSLQRNKGALELSPVKTRRSRTTLPLPPPLVTILRDHRREQLDRQLAAGKDWIDSGLVFTTEHGGPIDPRNLHRTFVPLLDRADVPRIRLHDLRHSCATLLFSTGADAATVQRVLRHSSIDVTSNTYMEVIESVQRDALDALMPLLFGDSHEDKHEGPGNGLPV